MRLKNKSISVQVPTCGNNRIRYKSGGSPDVTSKRSGLDCHQLLFSRRKARVR